MRAPRLGHYGCLNYQGVGITDTEHSEFCERPILRLGCASPPAGFCEVILKNLSYVIDVMRYYKLNAWPECLCVLFFIFGVHKICDLFFAAPSVNFCLKNSIKMRASCLFFIKKLFFDLTKAIPTAGAFYWSIFGGLNCQFRGICSNRELDCFNDFPICQWKSPRSKVTLVLTVRSPIFGGFGWLSYI